MIAAVESYLAVRRAAGFSLSNTEYLLRSFAGFAIERKQAHVRTATAIAWASQAKSVAQRHTRYQAICALPSTFAQKTRATNRRRQTILLIG
jgi:integrase/recombinase XerD